MGRHGVYTTTAQTIHTYDMHVWYTHTERERNNKQQTTNNENQQTTKIYSKCGRYLQHGASNITGLFIQFFGPQIQTSLGVVFCQRTGHVRKAWMFWTQTVVHDLFR